MDETDLSLWPLSSIFTRWISHKKLISCLLRRHEIEESERLLLPAVVLWASFLSGATRKMSQIPTSSLKHPAEFLGVFYCFLFAGHARAP